MPAYGSTRLRPLAAKPVPESMYPGFFAFPPFRKRREKEGARSNADGDVRVTAGREAGATSASSALCSRCSSSSSMGRLRPMFPLPSRSSLVGKGLLFKRESFRKKREKDGARMRWV